VGNEVGKRERRTVPLAVSAANARALLQQGRLAEARAVGAALAEREPQRAEAWRLLAVSCALAKDFTAALAAFREALRCEPDDPGTLHDYGIALLESGRRAEAVIWLRRAAQARAVAGWFLDLGNALSLTGGLEEAVGHYRSALALQPDMPEALCNLGCTLNALARHAEAVAPLRRATELEPRGVEALTNLGEALRLQGRFEEALALQRRARAPGATVATENNYGNTLVDSGDAEGAVAVFRAALARWPRNFQLRNNLAHALQQLDRLDEAVASYEQALALQPDSAAARHNLGIALLKSGQLGRGWDAYESRLRHAVRLHEPPGVVRWDGSLARPPQRLVLVTEQGLGDAIQFARYGALLRERGITAILQCPLQLTRLLGSAGGYEAVVPHGHEFPREGHAWFPLMSLPRMFGTDLSSVPATVPYLAAEPERVARWREFLDASPSGLRVGIAWQGNPEVEIRWLRGRSPPLAQFRPLAELEGITLISLQAGYGAEQLAQVDFGDRIRVPGEDCDRGSQAFLDTAALLMSLDLVVTSDTALAHLAGALGRPVWVLLHARSDWRWLMGRADSPWYPTMRLFRQRRLGEWEPVFAEVRAALRDAASHAGDVAR